ncbi:ROK family protein [Luteolibacter pohnpeiensis]|uniref:ROK family protein n=1 Tax=Luteolibacter pohnpeiensis TaxID=454153 RepID=A0A934VV60_9BACT|nr:ROK family protein [Luteolibacter pohnpeiensis]MBK1883237.1 ROK family protein [Luteolibacter pohnpeiensis]
MADLPSYFVGLDIGGTTVKSVIVNSNGEQVGDLVEVRSHVKNGYEATFAQLDSAIDQLTANAGVTKEAVRGIGLDVPAPSSDGVIWGRANLGDDWVGTDIRGKYMERTGIPVFMTNDGNAAALGEYALRLKHLGSLLLIAPGTGLGGGLVLPGGRSYEGANGLALEVGHISVPFREDDGELPQCSCGLKGCAEAWVSLVALRRRVGLELAKPENADHPLNQGDTTIEEKAFQLRDYAAKGDPLAVGIFKQQGFILGYAIADLVRVFDPGLVVIGGGLAETSFRDLYMEWIMDGFKDRAWPVYLRSPLDPEKITTQFQWAIGGDAAAAVGMAYTARELFQ